MSNKVYLSFGRHGRYGIDTAIDHTSMIEAFLGGRRLANELPKCRTIFYSPVARTMQTAKFRGLGMSCRHLISRRELEEEMPTFVIRKFIDMLIQSTEEGDEHFHFVSHQPVLEKLGLPELAICGICYCEAASWEDMLAEKFEVKQFPGITTAEIHETLRQMRIETDELEKFSPDGVYSALKRLP